MLDRFKKIISEVPYDKSFKTRFGELKSLTELRTALAERGQEFYNEFVNERENHFSNWIRGVFEDNELAAHLKKTTSSKEAIKVLDNKIKYAELWLAFNKDKEQLNKYLVNNVYKEISSIINLNYTPEHHKFETLSNAEFKGIEGITSITKIVNPPTSTFLPLLPFTNDEKKDRDEFNTEEILTNSLPLDNKSTVRHKKDRDMELARELEKQFPGIKLINDSNRKKSFFEKIISFFY